MIEWVHDVGNEWGRWMRRWPDWPYKSLAGTLVEYGSVGAAIKSHEQIVPIRDMPADVREFHSAWTVCEPRTKHTLYVFYYLHGDVKAKAASLGIAVRTLYDRVGRAQADIWSLMDLQSRMRKVLEVRT